MQNFLEDVVAQSLQLTDSPDKLIYVLPSRRAGSFLKQILSEKIGQTAFSPRIFSIEDFIEQISGIENASHAQLLFEMYKAYLQTGPSEPDSFYDFCKWGDTLIQDYNELDRYLIPVNKFFSYLADVKKLEQWTAGAGVTPFMENFLRFWNKLESIYLQFRENLVNKGLGYQGMIYRMAYEKIAPYAETNKEYTHVFLGFNALNNSEAGIIKYLLNQKQAEVFWDIDAYFINDKIHDAGYFIRQHRQKWDYLSGHPLKGISEYYTKPKQIEVTAIPKNVSQMKYVGVLLGKLKKQAAGTLEKTAVVLGDEALLNPLLHSIPEGINRVNITMGFPLIHTPLAALFSQFFELYLHKGSRGWYYKNVLAILSHPFIEPLFVSAGVNHAQKLVAQIKENNWIHLTAKRLKEVPELPQAATQLLFFDQTADPLTFIRKVQALILALKEHFQEDHHKLALEQLYRFFTLFNQLKEYMGLYQYVPDLKTLNSLYHSLLVNEKVHFRGEPLEGLQIMGMLESRNLDFETVILTSVNEGILPSGKSSNSFIPYDIKREFGLPTYKEKDAVYSYHFYRLLQRARNIYLTYNTEPDVLVGGERSRFIYQLLSDHSKAGQVQHAVLSPEILPNTPEPITIYKDKAIQVKLEALAARGFSPSSLTNYIKNPIDFYKKSLLGIDEAIAVDESITSSAFGTIVHSTLEDLYHPLVGKTLNQDLIQELLFKVERTVRQHFEATYSHSDINRGKNLIACQVLVRYIERLLNLEIEFVKRHTVKILALEQENKIALQIPGISYPIYIRGIIDRVDEVDGTLRILDYKTGKVAAADVTISEWNELTDNDKKSKAFQLLTYALMYMRVHGVTKLEAGIISLKNLNSGIMQFATRVGGGRAKNKGISEALIQEFTEILHQLLLEIFDPDTAFLEKKS